MEYEEMPVVEPQPVAHVEPSEPVVPKRGLMDRLGSIFFFLILFVLGIWLSTEFRPSFTPKPQGQVVPVPTVIVDLPTETIDTPPPATISASRTPVLGWQTYTILNVSYKLPPGVKAPTCDSSCVSYGTNLPGGTRFTVAPRGVGQPLPDFRNAILTDASGRAFTMSLLTVGSHEVYEYVGDFSGSTLQGYQFSKIRGLLVSVDDNTSIEFNHFSPQSAVTDFVSDDVLLTQIVGSVAIN